MHTQCTAHLNKDVYTFILVQGISVNDNQRTQDLAVISTVFKCETALHQLKVTAEWHSLVYMKLSCKKSNLILQ